MAFYCNGVNCAFDHVCKGRLAGKLWESGPPATVISFLRSWLQDWVACVIVSGAKSDDQKRDNSVLQGIVLGPPLWNYFKTDARFSVKDLGFIDTTFADNLNYWNSLDKGHLWEKCGSQIIGMPTQLTPWETTNGLTFAHQKQQQSIFIGRLNTLGTAFRLVCATFDAAQGRSQNRSEIK